MDSASYNEPYTEDASAFKAGSYTPQFNVAQHGVCAQTTRNGVCSFCRLNRVYR